MENKELLEKVIKNRLENSLSEDLDPEEKEAFFKEAMEAMDRHIELERVESTKKEQNLNRMVRYVEVVAVPVGLLMIDSFVKWRFMKTVCNFEKDYTFTTTPGRSISSFFRFKKWGFE